MMNPTTDEAESLDERIQETMLLLERNDVLLQNLTACLVNIREVKRDKSSTALNQIDQANICLSRTPSSSKSIASSTCSRKIPALENIPQCHGVAGSRTGSTTGSGTDSLLTLRAGGSSDDRMSSPVTVLPARVERGGRSAMRGSAAQRTVVTSDGGGQRQRSISTSGQRVRSKSQNAAENPEKSPASKQRENRFSLIPSIIRDRFGFGAERKDAGTERPKEVKRRSKSAVPRADASSGRPAGRPKSGSEVKGAKDRKYRAEPDSPRRRRRGGPKHAGRRRPDRDHMEAVRAEEEFILTEVSEQPLVRRAVANLMVERAGSGCAVSRDGPQYPGGHMHTPPRDLQYLPREAQPDSRPVGRKSHHRSEEPRRLRTQSLERGRRLTAGPDVRGRSGGYPSTSHPTDGRRSKVTLVRHKSDLTRSSKNEFLRRRASKTWSDQTGIVFIPKTDSRVCDMPDMTTIPGHHADSLSDVQMANITSSPEISHGQPIANKAVQDSNEDDIPSEVQQPNASDAELRDGVTPELQIETTVSNLESKESLPGIERVATDGSENSRVEQSQEKGDSVEVLLEERAPKETQMIETPTSLREDSVIDTIPMSTSDPVISLTIPNKATVPRKRKLSTEAFRTFQSKVNTIASIQSWKRVSSGVGTKLLSSSNSPLTNRSKEEPSSEQAGQQCDKISASSSVSELPSHDASAGGQPTTPVIAGLEVNQHPPASGQSTPDGQISVSSAQAGQTPTNNIKNTIRSTIQTKVNFMRSKLPGQQSDKQNERNLTVKDVKDANKDVESQKENVRAGGQEIADRHTGEGHASNKQPVPAVLSASPAVGLGGEADVGSRLGGSNSQLPLRLSVHRLTPIPSVESDDSQQQDNLGEVANSLADLDSKGAGGAVVAGGMEAKNERGTSDADARNRTPPTDSEGRAGQHRPSGGEAGNQTALGLTQGKGILKKVSNVDSPNPEVLQAQGGSSLRRSESSPLTSDRYDSPSAGAGMVRNTSGNNDKARTVKFDMPSFESETSVDLPDIIVDSNCGSGNNDELAALKDTANDETKAEETINLNEECNTATETTELPSPTQEIVVCPVKFTLGQEDNSEDETSLTLTENSAKSARQELSPSRLELKKEDDISSTNLALAQKCDKCLSGSEVGSRDGSIANVLDNVTEKVKNLGMRDSKILQILSDVITVLEVINDNSGKRRKAARPDSGEARSRSLPRRSRTREAQIDRESDRTQVIIQSLERLIAFQTEDSVSEDSGESDEGERNDGISRQKSDRTAISESGETDENSSQRSTTTSGLPRPNCLCLPTARPVTLAGGRTSRETSSGPPVNTGTALVPSTSALSQSRHGISISCPNLGSITRTSYLTVGSMKMTANSASSGDDDSFARTFVYNCRGDDDSTQHIGMNVPWNLTETYIGGNASEEDEDPTLSPTSPPFSLSPTTPNNVVSLSPTTPTSLMTEHFEALTTNGKPASRSNSTNERGGFISCSTNGKSGTRMSEVLSNPTNGEHELMHMDKSTIYNCIFGKETNI